MHQWAKNLLVFLPLLLAHSLHAGPMLAACAAFFCFCFTASATYIFNDLLDLEQDRIHLNKRKRAFAAGDLSVATGLGISFSLLRVRPGYGRLAAANSFSFTCCSISSPRWPILCR